VLDLLYRLSRPLLFSLDPEDAHHLVLSGAARCPGWVADMLAPKLPDGLQTDLAGLVLPTPIGLAAGLDKEAQAIPLWAKLGFGFVEVGTVTPHPQPGNPRPRVHRVTEHQALVNSMGFPSEGADVVVQRLQLLRDRDTWPATPVGVNLGKNKDTSADQAHEDYRVLAQRFRGLADYLAVNVSSPNTPGLRDLQAPEALARIAGTVVEEAPDIPVFVKLSPDLTDEAVGQAVETVLSVGVRGLIATNTTITRPVPSDEPGGMSGAPIHALAAGRIQAVLDAVGGRVPVVGVGGIDTPAKAADMLARGCAAVQIYTGFIYGGPALPSRLAWGLRERSAP
jgi:dihydroorotate dehydrogenase